MMPLTQSFGEMRALKPESFCRLALKVLIYCFVLDPSLLICLLGFPHCGSILAQAWFFTLFAMRTSSKWINLRVCNLYLLLFVLPPYVVQLPLIWAVFRWGLREAKGTLILGVTLHREPMSPLLHLLELLTNIGLSCRQFTPETS